MEYVQLDNFNGNINLICEDDGSGKVKIFNTLEEAEQEASDCQDGIVVGDGMVEFGVENLFIM